MDVFNNLLLALEREYDTVKVLKEVARGSVHLVRHRSSGKRYVLRQFTGSCEVYRKLLPIACANLPQIYEAAEQDGHSVVLEEYISGDSLAFLLEGSLLTAAEAKQVMLQLCAALHVLLH